MADNIVFAVTDQGYPVLLDTIAEDERGSLAKLARLRRRCL